MKNIKLSLLLSGLMVVSTFAREIPLVDATPNKIEFAWDLHDVVVKPSYPKMVTTAMYHGGFALTKLMGALIWDYTRYACTGTVGSAQQLIIDIKTAVKNGGTGDTIQHTLNAYNPKLGVAACKVGAELYTIKGVPEIIYELDQLGYTQRIASNIGTEEVKWLVEKHSELFSKFKDGKTVTYVDGTPSTKKPSPNYFEEYNTSYNTDGLKTIIFIDDKLKNITGAKQVNNFVPVHFKNAEQLRADLKKLGVPLS